MRILIATSLAVLALTACKPTEIGPGSEDARRREAAAEKPVGPPVQLPPSIAASRQYRCKDNSLAFVDWMSDGVTVNVRTESKGTPVQIKAPKAGDPFSGQGYTVKGGKDDDTITFSSPSVPKAQACNV